MKRPLEEPQQQEEEQSSTPPSSWWKAAVEWIRSNGGNVHSAISKNSSREPIVTRDVSKDTVLLEIPTSCVVSRRTVEATDIGKQLAACIRAVAAKQPLYTAEQDLLIALYLACQVASNQSDFPQVYLNTLPDRTEYDKLPRRWKDEDLENLLTGSCLLDRVRKSQQGLRGDYEHLSQAAQNQIIKSFPTFSSVDDMLAAVTSRAFAGLTDKNSSSDIGMVILLDLCNHHRGPRAKNVSYQLEGEDKVVVRAYTDLKKDDTLRITYGAQGNPQLLFNYGFCIPDNVEPDGSSNDVFEFVLKEGKPPVELRTGPKSYTYGPFVKVLELFHQDSTDGKGPTVARPDMDDMEAFLNECEDEDGAWDEEEGDDDDDEGKAEDSEVNNAQAETEALTALHQALEQVTQRYALAKQKSLGDADIERFAKILIGSELRTLRFYIDVCQKLIVKLTKQDADALGDVSQHDMFAPETFPTGDDERLDWQVNDLVDAFLRIRFLMLD